MLKFKYLRLLIWRASLNFFIHSFDNPPKFKLLRFRSLITVDFLKNWHSYSISVSIIGEQDDKFNFSILLKYVLKEYTTVVNISLLP